MLQRLLRLVHLAMIPSCEPNTILSLGGTKNPSLRELVIPLPPRKADE